MFTSLIRTAPYGAASPYPEEQRRDELPAAAPEEAGRAARHLPDVVGEHVAAVHPADGQRLEQRRAEQRYAGRVRVEPGEHVNTALGAGKEHGRPVRVVRAAEDMGQGHR